MNIPTISFGFKKLVIAQCCASIIAAVLWSTGSFIGGFGKPVIVAGLSQIGVLLVISWVFLLLYIPTKERPVATAAILWSGVSFLRFLSTLGVSVLLYYAVQFGALPLMFSFLLTAVLMLICETRVIAHDLSNISTKTKE